MHRIDACLYCSQSLKCCRAIDACNPKGEVMRSLAIRIALVAGLGMIVVAAPAAASPAVSGSNDAHPAKATTARYAGQPMCDEGGGRIRPCDMGGAYKKKKQKQKTNTKS
jgi:hypothetical protein